jgi:D-serine deaminase-like pyridoxal phosphate-dependent protein
MRRMPLDETTFDTPLLLVDHERLVANIAAMAADVGRRGVALRPHTKTHKSLEIARLQVEHGARGLTVATVGEAEVFADGGFDDLFVAYPVRAVGPKADRLAALARRVGLRVGVESVSSAEVLAVALAGTDAQVVVEVDSGGRRTGVTTAEDAARVADAARRGGLAVAGVFTHGGHSYAAPGVARSVAGQEVDALAAAAEALRADGHRVSVVSAGSTPTAVLAAAGDVVTEVRPGTYVFQDRLQVELGTARADQVSLVVAATVVSRHEGRVVVDAGAKTLSKDVPGALTGFGAVLGRPTLTIERLYDHHGVVAGPDDDLPALGEVVRIVPNHVCPVVDLSRDLTVALPTGRTVTWPVDARGQSR